MRYTVLWDKDVEDQFLNSWIGVNSSSRGTLTAIANWIDSILAEDPDSLGRPSEEPDLTTRTIAAPADVSTARVVVTFRVSADDRKVRVLRIMFSRE